MTKLLLAGVFKPFGVDDEYGEALNTMELLNNQVTREQGIHSPRSNNQSFGLYLLAENISVPTTVLDFPSWRDFTKEVSKGYTHIGISFIIPNVLRVKRMAEHIRQHSPGTKIIVGGHGTSIPNLEEIVDYDEVCRGEGVLWLRTIFRRAYGSAHRAPIGGFFREQLGLWRPGYRERRNRRPRRGMPKFLPLLRHVSQI